MTVAALAWAFRLTLPTTQKSVLLALADFTDESESCFPGVRLIADRASVSERTVKTNIPKLEAAGLLSRTRRYNGFGARNSDRYVLHVGVAYERPADVELEDVLGETDDEENPLGAKVAPNGGEHQHTAEATSGAKFAPDARDAPEPAENPLGAKIAPNAHGPVDNSDSGSPLGANPAPSGANPAPLKEEPPVLTPREQTSSSEAGHEPVGSGSNDDDGISFPGDDPEAFQRLLDAGIEASLQDVHPRLSLSEIRRRLDDAGLDHARVDIPAAAVQALAASARPVGDPSAYVAIAIIREPDRWPWGPLPVSGSQLGGAPSGCEALGCKYLDEWRMMCVRCGQEREGWRDERYAQDAPSAAVSS